MGGQGHERRARLVVGALAALLLALLGCGQASVVTGGGEDVEDVEDTRVDREERPVTPVDEDTIYGVKVPRASSWWVRADGVIHRGSEAITLRGLNWFGLETPDRALHGLWTGRPVESFLQQVRELGFNALRVPLSPESIRPGHAAAAWSWREGDGGAPVTTGRGHLDQLLALTADLGLYVLLDLHTCDPAVGGGHAAAPDACDGYELADWHADLAELAHLAAAWPHVVGVDLFNEPYGLTWQDWRALVDDAAEVVLTIAPRTLVFVEGVGGASPSGGAPPFWGANLTEAGDDPPAVPRARLVFSPHVYGPGVFAQPYFAAADYPQNMPALWELHFGYLRDLGYAVVLGEWGGFYDDARAPGEVAWNDAMVAWLASRDAPASFFYWALNPNSGDTGGLLEDDWLTPVRAKLDLLRPLLNP